MTGEVPRAAIMTSDRPAHCTETARADAAHMGRACADATEVRAHSAELRGAHSTEVRAAETTDMAAAKAAEVRSAAETADMGSAHCADMAAAEAPAETAVTTAEPAATAAASVSGASCGKSEHDDRRCCSENLRHDEPP